MVAGDTEWTCGDSSAGNWTKPSSPGGHDRCGSLPQSENGRADGPPGHIGSSATTRGGGAKRAVRRLRSRPSGTRPPRQRALDGFHAGELQIAGSLPGPYGGRRCGPAATWSAALAALGGWGRFHVGWSRSLRWCVSVRLLVVLLWRFLTVLPLVAA